MEVVEIKDEAQNVQVLVLRAENTNLIDFLPGQFITLFFKSGTKEIKRAFSISSVPEDLPYIKIAVKSTNESATHLFLNDIKVGSSIKALPPLGNFTLKKRNIYSDHLFFFGAGSGITPLISIIKSELLRENHTLITLVYSNHCESDIIFNNELDELCKKYKTRFEMIHVLSSPSNGITSYGGRLDKELLQSILMIYPKHELFNSDFFMCGPTDYMEMIRKYLIDEGIRKSQVHSEDFVVKILQSNDLSDLHTQEVTIFIDGTKHSIKVQTGETIMQAANKSGLILPCDCREGRCGTCKAKLLSGIIQLNNQKALCEAEIEVECCLTCVGYPVSEDIVVFYDND